MAYETNISPGAPPLLWSNIDQAFKQINQNFTELQLYLNDSTITPIDLNNLFTNLSPGDSDQFTLGSIDKKWKSVFTAGFSSVAGSELNGLWAGSAHIKGIGFTVNLPENSTIGGDPETGIGANLIIDPNKTFFKTISVDNLSSIDAPDFNSTLNINSGNSISISADNNNQTITINNSGVTSILSSTGISIDSSVGDITITNTGVTSLGPISTLPSGLSAGSGISVDSSTGNVTITNTGVISVAAGFGITVSTDAATGTTTVSNSAPAQVTFRNFIINGDTVDPISADNIADNFFLNIGYGLNFTKDTDTDTLSIEWNQKSDLVGSVFADDSTLLVNAVDGKIVGSIDSSDGVNSIIMDISQGLILGSSNSINLQGAAGAQIDIGSGTSGNILLGSGTNNIVVSNGTGFIANLTGNVNGDLTGSVFSDTSTMLIDGTEGKIVGPLDGNNFTGSLDFSGSTWTGVPGSSSISTFVDNNDFVNSGGVNFSYEVGDQSIGFNVNFSTPLTSTSKVRIAELQSDVIKGDLLGSVFSDTSSLIINGVDGSLMYYPSDVADWDGTAPTTVGEALDRLAVLIKILNSGTGA